MDELSLEHIQASLAYRLPGVRPYYRNTFPTGFVRKARENPTDRSTARRVDLLIQDFVCSTADTLSEFRWHDIDEMLFRLCLIYQVWPDFLSPSYPKVCYVNHQIPYWHKWIEPGDVVNFKVNGTKITFTM